nr:hypothetical protein CFP56_20581 [Quercus suber]
MASVLPAAAMAPADPRIGQEADIIGTSKEYDTQPPMYAESSSGSIVHANKPVAFEEYHYWATRTRDYEKTLSAKDAGIAAWISGILGKKNDSQPATKAVEKSNAKAVGPASWPLSRQLGYGPGTALYISFGFLAAYSGAQLWKIFLGLDSTKYPIRNYGDVELSVLHRSCFTHSRQCPRSRTNGPGPCLDRIFMLRFGASYLYALRICFGPDSHTSSPGMVSQLGRLAERLCNHHDYPPNEIASQASYGTPPGQPIITSGYWPPGLDLSDHINGLMQAVYSYGGATLFNELMAEMRRPLDFWKALICAETFIFSVYITMGLVVYSYQGQYTFNPAYQGIPNSAYAWQTVGNAINFISGLIAALLYGNIGIKVFYAAVLRDVFHLPELDKTTGKWIWVALVPIYWSLAFVLAAAIPQISYLSAFNGAATVLQFSYTFPPILFLGYIVQVDAMQGETPFDPAAGIIQRKDHGFKRFMRGYMKRPFLNSLNIVYCLGALATAGLGMYSSIIAMHASFANPDLSIKAFSCDSPTG